VFSQAELSDLEAIRQLTCDYADAYDRGDADGFARTFLPDGVSDSASIGLNRVEGRQAIADDIRHFRPQQQFVIHLATNQRVTVLDGDSAEGWCYFFAVGSVDGTRTLFAGRYDDRYERTPEGWKFRQRTLIALLPSQTGQLKN
jgi:ketosteroid isomerase-like protein